MPREPLPGTRVAEGGFQAKFMPINALISLHDFTPKLAPYPSFRAGAPQAVWCGAGPAMGAISNLFSRGLDICPSHHRTRTPYILILRGT